MRKRFSEELLNWGAHYVGIKGMKERQQNCITLDEICQEVLPLLYRYAPTTIEDQIPQFMEWGVSDLKGNMVYLKNSYLDKPWI
jgi:hypothetical protein